MKINHRGNYKNKKNKQQPKALWVVFAKNKNNGTRITTIEISEQ